MYIPIYYYYLSYFVLLFIWVSQFMELWSTRSCETKWCLTHQFPFNHLSILLFPALVYKFPIFSERQKHHIWKPKFN